MITNQIISLKFLSHIKFLKFKTHQFYYIKVVCVMQFYSCKISYLNKSIRQIPTNSKTSKTYAKIHSTDSNILKFKPTLNNTLIFQNLNNTNLTQNGYPKFETP